MSTGPIESGQVAWENIGWTLMHFVWQGAIVWALIALLVCLIPRRNSQARYAVLLGGLLLIIACPLTTSIWLMNTSSIAASEFQRNRMDSTQSAAIDFRSPANAEETGQVSVAKETLPKQAGHQDHIGSPILGRLSPNRVAEFCQRQMNWIVWLWIIGTGILTCRFAMGLVQLKRWRKYAQPVKDQSIQQRYKAVNKLVGLARPVELFRSCRLEVPVVLGWLRPIIIVPSSLITGLTPNELDALIAHELVHVKRHDHWVNLLQLGAETVLFYHPAVWWISRQIRIEREFCCDQVVIELKANRFVLAQALSKLEEHRMVFCHQSMGASGGSLIARIRRIAGQEVINSRWESFGWVLSMAVLLLFSIGIYSVNAVETTQGTKTLSFAPGISQTELVTASKLEDAQEIVDASDVGDSELDRSQSDTGSNEQELEVQPQLQTASKNGANITEAYVDAVTEGRSASKLLQHFSMLLQQYDNAEAAGWVTNMESIVSAYPSKFKGNRLEADEVLFNLPEGSSTRAVFKGTNVEFQPGSKFTTIKIHQGAVELYDSVGVRRAKAVSLNGNQLLVNCRYDQDEVVMTIRSSEKRADNSSEKSLVGVDLNVETGATEGEDDPPHGAIRFEVFEQRPGDDRPLRMKMKWRYQFSRLAREAEEESGKSWNELIFGAEQDGPKQSSKEELDSSGEVQAVNAEKPWIVNGTVTDAAGRRMKGVTVRAHAGAGTLRETGSDITDENGNYEFRFGPGFWTNTKGAVQAATISVSYPGFFEQNLHRQGDRVAALTRPYGEIGWGGKTDEDLFLPNKPKTINFVMLPATAMRGRILTQDGTPAKNFQISLTGEQLPPSSSVVANTRTDDEGFFELVDLPTGYAYQILVSPPKSKSPWLAWALPPMTFRTSATKEATGFSFMNDSQEESIKAKEIQLVLKGPGVNWKQALKKTARQSLDVDVSGESGVARIVVDMNSSTER